ncbi:MAG: ParB/RepB/Spo0J family partition protein [Candidatus Eutrophobiaceae bacterium]
MTKKRGLGRGLDALLGTAASDANGGEFPKTDFPAMREVDIDLLERGSCQPRRLFTQESLEELAASIKSQGILQPLVVRTAAKKGCYEIIAGERRWRAAQIAQLARVPVVVREVGDEDAMCLALIENLQREDLNPLEEAEGIQRLIEDFSLTQGKVAVILGCSRPAISNALRLLELEKEVKAMLAEGKLDMGHARALLALKGKQQVEMAKEVVRRKLTVRATEQLVRRLLSKHKPMMGELVDPNIRRLGEALGEHLGTPVSIKQGAGGKGVVEICYYSAQELDGIFKKMGYSGK